MFINDIFNDKNKALNEVSNELLGRYKKDKGVDEQAPPLNVPKGWEAKTQADGSTRISKIGSMSSADYKQNMANYKAQNWTPEKMADYGQRMASGQGYTDAERTANYQQQQKSFGQYADQPPQDVDEGRGFRGVGGGRRREDDEGYSRGRHGDQQAQELEYIKAVQAEKARKAAEKAKQDKGVTEAIPYALSAANAAAEYRRQGAVGGGYRGRIDIPVQSREDYLAVGQALSKAARAEGQKIDYGLSDGVMSIFSDSMTSDELDEFIDQVLDQGLAEGASSDLEQLIQQYEDMVENVYGMVPGPRQRQAIADRDALEARIEDLPGGKSALEKWARAYNDSFDEGVAEGGFDIPEIPRAPQPRPEPKNKSVGEGSVQDKLYRRQQELRKKRGAPDPEYYQELKKTYDMPDDERWARTAELKKKYQVQEGRKQEVNFDIEDIKKLERIRDLPTLKAQALALISRPSERPMKPEKVAWFDAALDRMDSPLKIIKLMYDLLLSGEGHSVIGSKNSMKSNTYRDRFGESTITNEDVEKYVEELERAGYEIVNEKRMTCPECGGPTVSDQLLAEKQDACYHKVKSRYKVWPSAYASGALVRCRKAGAKNWGNKSKK